MAAKTPVPPFAWLGRFWTPVGLVMVTVVGAFFRFYDLAALPPGLDETSARIGLQASSISLQNPIPSLSLFNGYSPLWVWLQAFSIQLLGHTAVALRIWPALLGTLAVLATWLWLRDWFGKRVAWVAALTLAVSPWAVSLSRNGLASATLPLATAVTLWLSGRALRRPDVKSYAALSLVLVIDLLCGPIGWLLVLSVFAVGIWRLAATRSLKTWTTERSIGLAVATAGLAGLGFLVGKSLKNIAHMPSDLGITSTFGAFSGNMAKVLLMFNVRGDENYRHNLAGEPLLNAFVGLMMIAGLLVCISRMHHLRYRAILLFTIVLLIPAVITTTESPNSSWAAGTLPLIFALAGIGTSYMLELWYATFPINSAARATGQAAIILLLALSLLQGYTQYFRAWAGSTAVYVAYNEGITQMAEGLRRFGFAGERYAVLPADQTPVLNYLNKDVGGFKTIIPGDLVGLPVATANRQFYIAAASRDESVKILKAKFPGGVLRPHYSPFNQVENYYTYEISK